MPSFILSSSSYARRIILAQIQRPPLQSLCAATYITEARPRQNLTRIIPTFSHCTKTYNDRYHSWLKQDGPCIISKHYLSTSAEPTEEDGDELPLFSSLETIHPASLHAITHKLKLTRMTEIQSKTFDAASTGSDVLGRARTGTGKTLAFLVPGIQSALRSGRLPGRHGYSEVDTADDDSGETTRQLKGGIAMLILSPTRELAIQIHNQAQVLTSSHSNYDNNNSTKKYPMVCQVMYGGSSRNNDLKKLQSNTPFILVATPGRLIDHMQNSHVNGVPFSEMIGNVSVLVLDEADRCLDMGFRSDMEWILEIMRRYQERQEQPQQRQTMLFSATFGKGLRSIMDQCMRKSYVTVDCVHDVDPTTHVNQSVVQTFVTLPPPPRQQRVAISTLNATNTSSTTSNADAGDELLQYRWISGLVDIISDIIHVRNHDDFKVVVFFPTTAMCQFFSHIFTNVYKIPVIELHSKKSQANRTYTSKLFRQLDKGILFTTDVSARGVDYPGVTHVVQFGSAESRETYIHRLGRTGRAGRKGKGIIIAGGKGEERAFIGRELQGLEIQRDDKYQSLLMGNIIAVDGDAGGGINGAKRRNDINAARLQKIRSSIRENKDPNLRNMASQTYRSLLGYLCSKMKTIGANYKSEVVEYVNSLAVQMGFELGNMPSVTPKVVNNIGLQGIRGLNVVDERKFGQHGSSKQKKERKKGGEVRRERRG